MRTVPRPSGATMTAAETKGSTESGPFGNFAKLWTSSTISNLGDGIDSAAIPLLAESITRNPLAFSGVAIASRLPWLLLSLPAGAIADRTDRRRLMVQCNIARFALMSLLSVLVLGGLDSILVLAATAFGLGSLEVLFDNASKTITPDVVESDRLEWANGRLFAGEIISNQFLGPPIGALLFGIIAALPMAFDAATFLVSAILLATLSGHFGPRRRPKDGPEDHKDAKPSHVDLSSQSNRRGRMLAEIREGLSWVWERRLFRVLALLLVVLNGATAMGYAILALYVVGDDSVVGLSQSGYGWILVTMAAGALLGSLTAERVVARIGRSMAVATALTAAGVGLLVLAATSSVWVVSGVLFFIGLTALLWNVVTVSLRQALAPPELLGRVNSAFRFLGWGVLPLAALAGGALGSTFGLRSPWLVGGILLIGAAVPGTVALRRAGIDTVSAAK